jgi:hypothetical protein
MNTHDFTLTVRLQLAPHIDPKDPALVRQAIETKLREFVGPNATVDVTLETDARQRVPTKP